MLSRNNSWKMSWSWIVIFCLALAGCGFTKNISYDGSPNNENVGELEAEGSLAMKQGEKRWIYGARGRCGYDAPSFREAVYDIGPIPDGVGMIYDAGVGVRISHVCGGTVKARAIGLKLNPNFIGVTEIAFSGTDTVTIVVYKP